MKTLSAMHLVQFSFWDYETFNLRKGGTAFLGPNGAGKTSLADAVQIALVGGHGNHTHFNSQSVHKDHRTVRDYALGMMRSGDGDKGVVTRKRDEALSYITLVFEGATPEDVVSAGLCLHSLATEKTHRTLGLYVVPGVRLKLEDHLGALDEGGKAPLDWSTFDALVRRLAKQAGRTPTLTAKPEAYLDELLHALQHKGRSIDRDKFLRSLAQSLRLKGIQSVNDYLRGYLVDAQPIDKQGTLKHIKTVRALVEQIEAVKQQIVQLNDIDRKFNGVARLYRTRAVASAVLLLLQVEASDDRLSKLKNEEINRSTRLEEMEVARQNRTQEEITLRAAHEDLAATYSADPAAQVPEQTRQLRQAREITVKERKQKIERLMLTVRDALATVGMALESSDKNAALAISELSIRWEDLAKSGKFATLSDANEALTVLNNASSAMEKLHQGDTDALAAANDRLKTAIERVRAAERGMRLPEAGDIPTAMALFRTKNIESRTVASLVSVTEVSWQGAIESFLGRNRQALLVDPGREKEAVRLLRTATKPLYDVTVVQPVHLKNEIGRHIDSKYVAALLKSDNEVALAYLRRIFGQMKQVKTEEELEENDRALTPDGMLSANGGTRRIRLISPAEWVLGAAISGEERQSLRDDVLKAHNAADEVKGKLALSKKADEETRRILKEVTVGGFGLALTEFQTAKAAADSILDSEQEALPEHLQKLRESVQAAKNAADSAAKELLKLVGNISTSKVNLETVQKDITSVSEDLSRLQKSYESATSDIDYDPNHAAEIYEYADGLARSGAAIDALNKLQSDTISANSRIVKAESEARTDFSAFINEMSINLVEERSDWRKAAQWTKNHVRKLTDSTLVDYEKDAEAARQAANQSFRADVAYRMREAIKRVEHDISDLNRILKTCPEFTGGEKYRFVAEPSLAHKGMYELIQSSALIDAGTAPLFESGDEVQKKLIGFLEACEQGTDKANNPLEDYRLLFNFDLEIHVGDKKVDSLSKRLGVGSNGEHLVPFYVIAGASLANAYRIKAGDAHDGVAVMIVDEAFHGFDAQNTYVTAQFLRSLGLQLVMAAPDADVGKLTPVLDSYYDLDRYGADVFTEEILVKDEARTLLESDMPNRNPQLVERLVEQLSLS